MDGYELECAQTFLKNQSKLFREPVAETVDEALEFLEDCFACVLDSVNDIRAYWEENGIDIEGMTDEDILDSAEVLELPSGKYLVIEV